MNFNAGGGYGAYGGGAGGYQQQAAAPSYGGGGSSMGGGGYGASPNKSSQEEKSPASVQKLTPLLVSQIHGAQQLPQEDAFKVDGQHLNQVTIVGTIVSVQKLSTNLTMQVKDETGTVEVRMWLENDDQNANKWREGLIVKVVGHVREFQERRSVLAFKLIPVEDQSDLELHKLEATYAHLYNLHGALPAETDENKGVAGAAGGAAGGASAYQASTAFRGAGAAGGGFTPIQQAVLNMIKAQSNTQEGAHIGSVSQNLAQLGSPKQIKDAVDWLSQEGHIYSTISDEFYKSVDM